MKTTIQLFAIAIASLFVLPGFTVADDPRPSDDEPALKTFVVDQVHSNVGFKVRHLGITNVNGQFDEYDATITLDPENLSTLEAEATIQIASINTGNERRDGHLKSDDFFNAEAHPAMKFVSNKVVPGDNGAFELHGDLTIRDVTKPVVLEGALLGTGMTREGKQKVGLEASTTINRFDYNLKWDQVTEAGGLVVGQDVQIILELQLNEHSES